MLCRCTGNCPVRNTVFFHNSTSRRSITSCHSDKMFSRRAKSGQSSFHRGTICNNRFIKLASRPKEKSFSEPPSPLDLGGMSRTIRLERTDPETQLNPDGKFVAVTAAAEEACS